MSNVEVKVKVDSVKRSSRHKSQAKLYDSESTTTMSSTSNLTLPALYRRTLHSLLPIFNDDISSSLPSTQQTLQDSLTDLDLVIRMSSTLGIFSDNEQVDDVGDGELPLMAVEWIKGEVLGRVNGDGIKERLKVLKSSQVSVDSPFLLLLL